MWDKIGKFLGFKRSSTTGPLPAWLRASAAEEQQNLLDVDSHSGQVDLYSKLTWIQIAISAVTKLAASTPLEVVRVVDEEEISVKNHPLELLLQKPNPLNSRFELLQATLSFLCLTGNAYWWLNRVNANTFPTEIWLLPGDKVAPVPDGNLFLRGYSYTTNNETFFLDPWEVCHFKLFNPGSFFVGLSPLQTLMQVAAGDLAMTRYNANYFDRNHAKLPGALAFADPIDDDSWEQLKREISEEYGGVRRRLMLLRNTGTSGVSWIPMALSQAEMQFLESRKANKEEIFALFSPGLASILDVNATEANAQAGRATFIELAIWPLLNLLAERMTSSLLHSADETAVVRFEDIRVVNRAAELEEIRIFSQFHTLDEVRARWFQAAPLGDSRGNLLQAEVPLLAGQGTENGFQADRNSSASVSMPSISSSANSSPYGLPALSSEESARRQEVKALRRWLRNHPSQSYTSFKARYLRPEEIRQIAEAREDSVAVDARFRGYI